MDSQVVSFSSSNDNLVVAEKLVDDVCRHFKVDEDYYGNILIAVTEAVNNAIHHGNRLDPSKSVTIEFVAFNKHQLHFTIKDQGVGFDYNALPDPTDPENIDKISGRGVFLMKNLSDELRFNDTGSSVEMVFCVN